MEALRPPLVNPDLKRVMGTEAEPTFELAPGVAQVFNQVYLSDEPLLQQTSNDGNLPMASRKKRRPNRLHTHTHSPKRLAHPRSPIPPLSTLTSRATHAHPTSPRSTGFCAIWGCISSSSRGGASRTRPRPRPRSIPPTHDGSVLFRCLIENEQNFFGSI